MTPINIQIIEAALPAIAFDGWGWKALEDGTKAAGFDRGMARIAFPGGPVEALLLWIDDADHAMLETLRSDYTLSTMKIRERIATAVMVRLRQNAPHREAVRRGMALLSLPWNAAAGMKSLYGTVDAIWRESGDTSLDWNFYTKRLMLAKVYTTTLRAWLEDDTPDLRETETFLHRRIEDVMRIEKAKAKLRGFFGGEMSSKPRRA